MQTEDKIKLPGGKTLPFKSCLAYPEQVDHGIGHQHTTGEVTIKVERQDPETEPINIETEICNTIKLEEVHIISELPVKATGSKQKVKSPIKTEIKTEELNIYSELPGTGINSLSAFEIPMKCYLCAPPKEMKNRTALNLHLDDFHPEQETYRCKECQLTFPRKRALNLHLSNHKSSIKQFKCAICPLMFRREIDVKEHEYYVHNQIKDKRVDAQTTRQCSLCKAWMKITSWDQHVCSKSSAPVEISCADCAMIFNSKWRLTKHRSAMHNIRSEFKCYLCAPDTVTVMKDEISLHEHLASDHRYINTYFCEECNKPVKSAKAMNWHLRRHDPAKKNSKRSHKKRNEAVCKSNSKSDALKQKSERREEITVELMFGTATRRYKVSKKVKVRSSQLAESSKISSTYSRLMKRALIGRVIRKCYLCNENVAQTNKTTLSQHLETAHPSQQVYNCSKCNYSTEKKDALNNHLSRHDGSKRPFKCRSCALKFLTAKSRINHEAFRHNKKLSGGTHYCCVVCDKQFALKYKLRLHEKTDSHCSVIIRETESKMLSEEFSFFLP